LSVRLARLYRAWLRLALALLALGLVLDVFEDGRLEQATVPLGALPEQLFRGDPAAFESLAMLVAVLGPVCGLLLMLVTCVRRGDRRTASLAALVLVVVAVLPVARSLGGR
ncbi:MAG: DUF1634 domain-containing protein, partial [Thermomicrobium sp.]|nr:DUF1634 domain-containing protein [Thermomicrobium sp.]